MVDDIWTQDTPEALLLQEYAVLTRMIAYGQWWYCHKMLEECAKVLRIDKLQVSAVRDRLVKKNLVCRRKGQPHYASYNNVRHKRYYDTFQYAVGHPYHPPITVERLRSQIKPTNRPGGPLC